MLRFQLGKTVIPNGKKMKISTKVVLFFVAVCLSVGGYFVGVSCAQKTRVTPGFLQSTSVHIQLGVWDKFGVDETNKATFIVTGLDGKIYRIERSQSLDDWAYVSFPDDFSYPLNNASYDLYSWTCVVGGKTVAEGKFRWGNGQADDDNRNLK
jgi:hypothetical protein